VVVSDDRLSADLDELGSAYYIVPPKNMHTDGGRSMNNTECLFCRIVSGDVPATRVYEDERHLAIMDIGPIVKGHVLVIPKEHHPDILAMPGEQLKDLIGCIQTVCRALREGLHAEGINVIQNNGRAAGQLVPHVHFHAIPRFAADGHRWNWDAKKYSSPAEMDEYAERIRRALCR